MDMNFNERPPPKGDSPFELIVIFELKYKKLNYNGKSFFKGYPCEYLC